MVCKIPELALFQFQECRMHAIELESRYSCRAVSMLFDEDLCYAVLLGLILISVFSMDKHNDIGILLD